MDQYIHDINNLVEQATHRGVSRITFPAITEAVDRTSNDRDFPTGFVPGPFRIDIDMEWAFDESKSSESLKRKYTQYHPDFKPTNDSRESSEAKTYIEVFYECVVDCIRSVCEFREEELMLTDKPYASAEEWYCIVTEKSRPRLNTKGIVKDGFHMSFPFLNLPVWVSDGVLFDEIQRRMVRSGVWKGLKCITPHADFLDGGMHKKPWMMYGSGNYKDPANFAPGFHNEPYLYFRFSVIAEASDTTLTTVVDSEPEWFTSPSESSEPTFTTDRGMCLVRRFPISEESDSIDWEGGETVHVNIVEFFYDEDSLEEEKDVIFELPRLLSIRKIVENTAALTEFTKKKKRKYTAKSHLLIGMASDMSDLEATELKTWLGEHEIMENIADWRAGPHATRMEIGWILYCIFKGHISGLEIWDDFCMRDPDEYVEGKCQKRWREMKMGRYTLSSLLRLMKKDSPEAYNLFAEQDFINIIKESLDSRYGTGVNERMLCSLVLKMYPGQFLVSPQDKAESDGGIFMYSYEHHKWQSFRYDVQGNAILKQVWEKYKEFINNISSHYNYDASSDSDRKKRNAREIFCKKYLDFLSKSGAAGKVFSFMGSLNIDEIVVENFISEVANDVDRGIVGFKNGVFDRNRKIFRPGMPSDYNTFSTERTFFDWADIKDSAEAYELFELLGKTFVDRELQDFFWDYEANSIDGNPKKVVVLETGPTNGGKSIILLLRQCMYGDYGGIYPGEELVKSNGKRDMNNPHLARHRNRFRLQCPEIGKKPIDQARFKQLSGGDSQVALEKFQRGSDAKAMKLCYGLSCQMNGVPRLGSAEDEATLERCVVLMYASYFFIQGKKNLGIRVPETEEEQYHHRIFDADPSIKPRIEKVYADVAISYLIHHYCTTYSQYGIRKVEGGIIEKSGDAFKAEDDYYLRFVTSHLLRLPIRYGKPNKNGKRKTLEFKKGGDTPECVKGKILFGVFKEWYEEQYPSSSKFSRGGGMKEFRKNIEKLIGIHHKDIESTSVTQSTSGEPAFLDTDNINSIITGNIVRKKTWPHGVRADGASWLIAGYLLVYNDEEDESSEEDDPFSKKEEDGFFSKNEAGPSS